MVSNENDSRYKKLERMDENFDFIDDDVDDLDQEIDEVSNALLLRFEHAPIPHGHLEDWRNSSRHLKFKLNPNGIDGIGYFTTDLNDSKKIFSGETELYPARIPTFDDSLFYVEYVSNLYGIYEALGDERYYSVATIGVVKKDAQREQDEVLSKAFSLTINELELLIERKRENNDDEKTVFELEECLNILNCLKALFFTEDYEVPSLLSRWINIADPQPTPEFTASVMESEKPYEHPYFWTFIYQLTLRGLYQEASNVINDSGYTELASTESDLFNLFTDAANLLRSYPEKSPTQIFKQWKTTALTAANNANIPNPKNQNASKGIRTLLNIIAGNKTTILETAETWYEALVGLIFYSIPSVKLIPEYFEASLQTHQPDSTCIWESASVDIFSGSFLQVLRAISSFSSATAAYTSALCEAKGLLRGYSFDDDNNDNTNLNSRAERILRDASFLNQDIFSTKSISEFLLHTHALDCLSIEKLVPVGIGLLALSRNPSARNVIAEYLPKYNFKTNDDIEWALTVCASLKLPQIAHVIFRIAAQRSLASGLLLEALTLFARAGEIEFIKHHAWLVFETSLIYGEPLDDIVMNAVVDDSIVIKDVDPETLNLQPLLRQSLSPYAVLYQFWKLKKDGSLKLALGKLILLIKFPYLPTRLFGLLLSQLTPFIISQAPPNLISEKDLLAIIEKLNHFEKEVFSGDNKKSLKLKDDADKLYISSISLSVTQKLKAENHWIKELETKEIAIPSSLTNLIKFVRRSLAIEIGRSFLEEKYV